MTWLQRHQLRSFLRNSLWLPPLLGMVIGLLARPVIHQIDAALGLTADVSPEGARAVLGALVAALLTFIVFVFSILLLTVQIASAQLTPRIIAGIYRSRVLRFSLTLFVFSFTFVLGAMARIEDRVPQVLIWVAVYSSVASIVVFLYMIDNVGMSLRPVSILAWVGRTGQKVIESVYPLPFDATQERPTNLPLRGCDEPSREVASRRTGVVQALDVPGLVALATRADCLIEFVPLVGDFVTAGDALFRIHGGGAAITERELDHAVAVAPERTMEQDPEFAFRIVVDIAAKALSPAINDPTTAVLALDQVQRLLRVVARRQLDTGRVHDNGGTLRLSYRTPDWKDFVTLGVMEIRHYGRESIQIVRRMRAVLQALIAIVPPQRAVELRRQLDLLGRGLQLDFRDPEDREHAGDGDTLGVGGKS